MIRTLRLVDEGEATLLEIKVEDLGPSEFAGRRDFLVTLEGEPAETAPMRGARPDMPPLMLAHEAIRAIATERERLAMLEEDMRSGRPLLPPEVSEEEREVARRSVPKRLAVPSDAA